VWALTGQELSCVALQRVSGCSKLRDAPCRVRGCSSSFLPGGWRSVELGVGLCGHALHTRVSAVGLPRPPALAALADGCCRFQGAREEEGLRCVGPRTMLERSLEPPVARLKAPAGRLALGAAAERLLFS